MGLRIFFLLLCISSSAIAALSPTTDPTLHTYTLKNGLRLIVKEDHRAPVVLSEIWYKVGSANETDGSTGLAHLLEHMMFQGTPQYGEGVLMNKVDESGGEINAMTTEDFTMYYEKLSNTELPLSFQIESDRMKNLNFNEKNFNKEKQVVINERKLRTDNDPKAVTYERLNAIAYLNHPYRHPVVGWMNDLNHMELKEAHDFYKTWYTPNNAVVVVAGDVNPEKVYELAKQYFGPLTPHPVPSIKPVPLQKTVSKKWVDVSLPAQLPFLFMGYEVPSHGSEPHSLEPYALEVMAAILDGDGSARLTRHLLRDEEIATAADAQYSLYNRYSGLFLLLGIPTPTHSMDELRESFLKEIKDLKTTLVPEEELRRIKMRLIATKTYDKDSLSTVAFELGNTAILGLPLEEVAAYERKIQSVTPEDIQAVAKKYFTKENLSVATLIPLPTNPSETSSPSTPSGEFHHGV